MTDIKQIIYDNLNAAIENNYDVRSWPVDDIVHDLRCWAADCEDMEADKLKPYVEAWLKENSDGH